MDFFDTHKTIKEMSKPFKSAEKWVFCSILYRENLAKTEIQWTDENIIQENLDEDFDTNEFWLSEFKHIDIYW